MASIAGCAPIVLVDTDDGSGATSGGSSGSGQECWSPSECPPGDECASASCTDGACGRLAINDATACGPGEHTCKGGLCVCSAGTQCGAVCVDLASDAMNCGSCGHDCQGGACQDSLCQPVTLASGLIFPNGLAVDATSVY